MAAKGKRRFILAHHRSPGDLVCLTALMRDIHLTYPGEFETDFNTTVTPVWGNNPYITRLWNHNDKDPKILKPDTKMITCQYGKGIREQNNETIHFCAYFHRDFKKQTGIDVQMHRPHGDIHLSEYEKTTPPVNGRYWLILTGGKSDFTIKVWHTNYFQEVSDRLGDIGLGVVQTGASHSGHWHPKLKGDHVIDLCGWGSFRELVQQIHHAEGVICGVTGAMHLAAALHKPCVVIAGGREAWWWESYCRENKGFGKNCPPHPVPHRFLHTIGLLDCCAHAGCWKNKVVPTGKDKLICKKPVMTPEMPIAECMRMITPDHVMEAVMSYYTDSSLPPIKLMGSTQQPLTLSNALVPINTPIPPEGTSEMTGAIIPRETTDKLAACPPPSPPRHKMRTSASIVVPKGVPITINPKAKINVRDATGATKPRNASDFTNDTILDHPAVGGKYTVCILFYGDFFELHKQCLTSLLATVSSKRMDLRVGSNALGPQSLEMIEQYVNQGVITKHYRHDENAYKYPVMREMFWDADCPITTKWIIWFDDDSICDVEQNWLNIMSTHIAQHHKGKTAHMLGANFVWTTNKRQRDILEARPWFKGMPWRNHLGAGSPNGNRILFVTGGFWAITTEAMRAADIPDLGTGLTHNGGDWQIGEQIYQAGYGIRQFNGSKQFVRTSSVKRRGVTKPTIDQVEQISTKVAAEAPPALPKQPALKPPMQTQPAPKLRRIVNL